MSEDRFEKHFEKIWDIHYGDSVNQIVVGGICVSENGYILTTALGIKAPQANTRIIGRSYSCLVWHKLEFIYQQRNFNLTLLKLEQPNKKFPYFADLDLEMGNLERGEVLHAIIHRDDLPFSVRYGSTSHSFSSNVHSPNHSPTETLFNTQDLRSEVHSRHVENLCVAHIISMDEDDEDDNPNEDCQLEPDLRFLYPYMPVIQCQGLGCEGSFNGSFGCPVFGANEVMVGLFHFIRGEYQYIIPRTFLKLFFNHSKKVECQKRKGKKKTEDSPPDYKDMRRKSVTKRLDEAKKLPHFPRINFNIPHITDAWFAHERLLQRLQDYGFHEEKVPENGDCQFSALAQLIGGSPDQHNQVRKMIVEQLTVSRRSYERFVKMKYKAYCKKMAKSGEWGDHVTIQAATDKFAAKICLFTLQKGEETCFIEIVPKGQAPPFKNVYWLSYWAKVYYNPLRRNEGRSSAGNAARGSGNEPRSGSPMSQLRRLFAKPMKEKESGQGTQR